MKLKTSVKYYISRFKNAAVIYYCVIIGFIILFALLKLFDVNSNINGLEISTVFFVFIVGLNSFKSEFKFLMQNGVSRSSIALVPIISSVVVVILAVADLLIGAIAPIIGITCSTLLSQVFKSIIGAGLVYYLQMLLYYMTLYASLFMLGHFISLLYYRLSTLGKVIVSIAGVLFMNVILNLIAAGVTFGGISIITILTGMLGFFGSPTNTLIPSLFNIMYFVILSGISYMMTRKALIKK